MKILDEIRSEIEELKKYRKFLYKLENEEKTTEKKDKPKVKKLEVRKNEHK